MTSVIRGSDNVDSSRIVEAEDFGIGSLDSVNLVGTIDSETIPSGTYRVVIANNAGTYPEGHNGGTLEVLRYNAQATQQKFTVPTRNFEYFVRYVSTDKLDSPWERVYTSGASGQLSHRNVLLNGDFRINQRIFSGNWSTLSDGDYGYDRWKKSGTNIQQVVEDGNYKPNTIYTLSGVGISSSQITSPASGHWTITVPNTASKIQLEEGRIQTPFELRNIGVELNLCYRYYVETGPCSYYTNQYSSGNFNSDITFPVAMRAIPTVTIQQTGTAIAVPVNGPGLISRLKFHINSGSSGSNINSYVADAEL